MPALHGCQIWFNLDKHLAQVWHRVDAQLMVANSITIVLMIITEQLLSQYIYSFIPHIFWGHMLLAEPCSLPQGYSYEPDKQSSCPEDAQTNTLIELLLFHFLLDLLTSATTFICCPFPVSPTLNQKLLFPQWFDAINIPETSSHVTCSFHMSSGPWQSGLGTGFGMKQPCPQTWLRPSLPQMLSLPSLSGLLERSDQCVSEAWHNAYLIWFKNL